MPDNKVVSDAERFLALSLGIVVTTTHMSPYIYACLFYPHIAGDLSARKCFFNLQPSDYPARNIKKIFTNTIILFFSK